MTVDPLLIEWVAATAGPLEASTGHPVLIKTGNTSSSSSSSSSSSLSISD